MDEGRKSIYADLEKRLNGFPVDDFVREYAKAYLDADVETIQKLQTLILDREVQQGDDGSDSGEPDALRGAPRKPRPHLNS